MTDLKRTFLFCLLGLCIYAFGFICWLYPIIWAPKPEVTEQVEEEKYHTHYVVMPYGQCIKVYKLKEHKE